MTSVTLALDRLPSPVGELLVLFDDEERLCALDFDDHEARMRRLLRLRHGESCPEPRRATAPAAIRAALEAFFGGSLEALERLEVRTGGTAFQQTVWGALRRIPAGTTSTYSGLARAIGRPSACRAVGLANGANPIGIVVPCHRVIGADGSLTGYGGGIQRKRWLLDHERKWSER